VNLRDELANIYKDQGELTPKIVVDLARKKDHPLHSVVFDCEPRLAAERYYLDRAHELIQSVKITYRDPKSSDRLTVRSWQAIKQGNNHVYKPTDEIVTDPILRAIVLADMEREWKDLHRRYKHFKEFLDLVLKDVSTAA
jgi:hypothetical protein